MTTLSKRFALLVLFVLWAPLLQAADKITLSSTNPTAFDIDHPYLIVLRGSLRERLSMTTTLALRHPEVRSEHREDRPEG